MKLVAKFDTVIKVRPDQSSLLDENQLIEIPKGTEIEVQDVIQDEGHLCVQAFLYKGHVKTDNVFKYTQEDIDIVARTLWGEARGENYQGRLAVAWVVRNRATKSPAYNWPNTPKGVCLQPWQFSCWNENDPNLSELKQVTTQDPIFKECLAIAKFVLTGDIADPTLEADHYYASWIKTPPWAVGKKVTATIGQHRFYKLI